MKRLIIPTLLLVVTLSSCSSNEITELNHLSRDAEYVGINVSSGVSKADQTTSSLNNDGGAIKLHMVESGKSGVVHDFAWSSDEWSSATAPKWTDVTFPITFHSAHDGTPLTLDTSTATEGTIVDYEIEDIPSNQKDLIIYSGTLNNTPASGNINAFHTHALSKVNILAGIGTNKVTIASIRLVNVDGKATATIKPENNITWTESDPESYIYYKPNATVVFSNSGTASDSYRTDVIGSDAILMIPQITTAATITAPTSGTAATVDSGSYIEVIYCLEDSDGNPIVGYTDISKHPNAANITSPAAGTPLYVKVGFPVGFTFNNNNQYDITLGLGMTGSTGGITLEDNYVDKDGNIITITPCTDTEVEPGEPVFPDENATIGITVTTTNWVITTEDEQVK